MKKFFKEFGEFISKGNVLDLAVGVIIGAAFKDIVTSLTDNVINPLLNLFGKADVGAVLVINEKCQINYGAFITAIINFIIMAFVVFCIVKSVKSAEKMKNKLKEKVSKKEEKEEAPTTKICPFCKSEIAIDATRCPHCTSELDK